MTRPSLEPVAKSMVRRFGQVFKAQLSNVLTYEVNGNLVGMNRVAAYGYSMAVEQRPRAYPPYKIEEARINEARMNWNRPCASQRLHIATVLSLLEGKHLTPSIYRTRSAHSCATSAILIPVAAAYQKALRPVHHIPGGHH